MAKSYFFSIIIPCLNEEKYLPLLLHDLSQQTLKDFEVIIVDGKSEDKTISNIQKFKTLLPKLTILSSSKRNVSLQRNLGGAKAVGQYLVFNDADNRLPNYFIEGLRYQLRVHPVDLFTCWSESSLADTKDKTVATACNLILEASLLTKNPSAFGALIGCKSSVFPQTPQFNPKIGFAEDTDFIRKAYKMGFSFKIFHNPRYYYSLRRFHTQGNLKVIQKSARLFLKYLTGQTIDQVTEYPMGGKAFNSKNPDFFQRIDNFLNTPIRKPKILERLQSILDLEE